MQFQSKHAAAILGSAMHTWRRAMREESYLALSFDEVFTRSYRILAWHELLLSLARAFLLFAAFWGLVFSGRRWNDSCASRGRATKRMACERKEGG